MKATVPYNIDYCEIVEKELQIKFAGNEMRLNGWGDADNHVYLSDNVLVLAEIENGQKHPQANVLKLWPYLEEEKTVRIILIHWLTRFSDPKISPNRKKLCEFTGNKLETLFPGRFKYILLKDQQYQEELKQAKKFIKELTNQ
jgi:hypothetical protein